MHACLGNSFRVQGRLHHGMHEAIVQRRIVVVFKHTRVHATDLDPVCDLRASAGFNSESGSPVPSNTREFVESLIRELGPKYKVGITFSLPKSGNLRIRPLWRILHFPCLIFQFLVPLTEDDWDHVVRWGRTTLPHGRFQEHNEIISVTSSVVSRP